VGYIDTDVTGTSVTGTSASFSATSGGDSVTGLSFRTAAKKKANVTSPTHKPVKNPKANDPQDM
jgi:hypothetical protein